MRWLAIAVQIATLTAIFRAATLIVDVLHLPMPGNVKFIQWTAQRIIGGSRR